MADAPFTDEQIAWLDARYRLGVPTVEALAMERAGVDAEMLTDAAPEDDLLPLLRAAASDLDH